MINPYKPKIFNMGSTETLCILCCHQLPAGEGVAGVKSEIQDIPPPPPPPTEFPGCEGLADLNEQLRIYFIITKLFRVNINECVRFVSSFDCDVLHSWFKLCDACGSLVNQGIGLHSKILGLQRDMKGLGETLEETVRRTRRFERGNIWFESDVPRKIRRILMCRDEVSESQIVKTEPNDLNSEVEMDGIGIISFSSNLEDNAAHQVVDNELSTDTIEKYTEVMNEASITQKRDGSNYNSNCERDECSSDSEYKPSGNKSRKNARKLSHRRRKRRKPNDEQNDENFASNNNNEVFQRAFPNLSKCVALVYQLFSWVDSERMWKCKLCPSKFQHHKHGGSSTLNKHAQRKHKTAFQRLKPGIAPIHETDGNSNVASTTTSSMQSVSVCKEYIKDEPLTTEVIKLTGQDEQTCMSESGGLQNAAVPKCINFSHNDDGDGDPVCDKDGAFQRAVPNLSKCGALVYQLFSWTDSERMWKCKLCPSKFQHHKSGGSSTLNKHAQRKHKTAFQRLKPGIDYIQETDTNVASTASPPKQSVCKEYIKEEGFTTEVAKLTDLNDQTWTRESEGSQHSAVQNCIDFLDDGDEDAESDNDEVCQRAVPNLSKCRALVYQLFSWVETERMWKCKLCRSKFQHHKHGGSSTLNKHAYRKHKTTFQRLRPGIDPIQETEGNVESTKQVPQKRRKAKIRKNFKDDTTTSEDSDGSSSTDCNDRTSGNERRNMYACKKCKSVYKSVRGYLRHKQEHKRSVKLNHKFDCECGFPCSSERKLRYHNTRVHRKKVMLQCNQCNYQALKPGLLRQHMKKHTVSYKPRNVGRPRKFNFNRVDGKFGCSICSASYRSRDTLSRHMGHHKISLANNGKYDCDICYYPCRNENRLHWHRTAKHDKKECLTCEYCNQKFARANVLKTHLELHKQYDDLMDPTTGKFRCKFCPMEFLSLRGLQIHMRCIHKNESKPSKSFLCSHCGECFSSEGVLRRHIRNKHEDTYKFTCEVCGKGIESKRCLISHMRTHEENRIQEYICEICGVAYSHGKTLTAHKAKFHHSGDDSEHKTYMENEGEYKCRWCNSVFLHKYLLLRHIPTHKDVFAFKCDTCGKAYTSASSLKLHAEISHSNGRNKFSCKYCGNVYPHKHNVICHYRYCRVKREMSNSNLSNPNLSFADMSKADAKSEASESIDSLLHSTTATGSVRY